MLEQDVTSAYWHLEIKELNIELKGGIWRDYTSSTSGTVGVIWRANQGGFLSLGKLSDTLVPSFDDLADTNLEVEWSTLLNGGVEDSAVLQSSVVMDCYHSAWWAFWTGTLVVNLYLE